MCKWLISAVPFDTTNKRLSIEFQNPYVNKAGDSAGVTFAVSGYSLLKATPLRKSVAMTGSVRANGNIKAVGGVPQKINGAATKSEGIEVIIVPKENEPDLSCVPVDQLCKLVVITGNDIKTYLKYALAPTPGNASNEQYAASQIIAAAQHAQVLLLTGRYEAARQLLTKISKTNPEIYSARRLLAILRRKMPLEQPLEAGDRIEVQKISSQLDGLVSPKTNLPASTVTTVASTINSQDAASPVHTITPVAVTTKSQGVAAPDRDGKDSSTPNTAPWWKKYWYVILIGVIFVIYKLMPSKS